MAQVRKNKVIVLASVLKPVDETRMHEKLAHTLAQSDHPTIHIIGFPSAGLPELPNIHFHPIRPKSFARISFSRWIASWNYFRVLWQLRPDVIIFTTHELMASTVLYGFLRKCRVIYDVQENYFRNLWYVRTFPWGVSHVLACYVRLKETILAPFVHHFLLAERAYAMELPFVRSAIVLQNKLPRYLAEAYKRPEPRGYSRFLFSGTLAESTGVFEVIELVKTIRKHVPEATLTVVGHCSQRDCRYRLMQEQHHHDFLRVDMADTPLPHTRILEAVRAADVGLVLYPPNPSTSGSIPTKVYEYLALGLPMIIRHTRESHHLVRTYRAGIILDQNIDIESIINELNSINLIEAGPEVYWDHDAPALTELIKSY